MAVAFTVPESAPGPVVIVATQRRPVADPKAPEAPPTTFTDEYGTPARTTLRVLAPGERLAPVVREDQLVAGSDGSTTLIVFLVLFGAVALSLFAGGVMAFLHQMRSRGRVAQVWPPREWR